MARIKVLPVKWDANIYYSGRREEYRVDVFDYKGEYSTGIHASLMVSFVPEFPEHIEYERDEILDWWYTETDAPHWLRDQIKAQFNLAHNT